MKLENKAAEEIFGEDWKNLKSDSELENAKNLADWWGKKLTIAEDKIRRMNLQIKELKKKLSTKKIVRK